VLEYKPPRVPDTRSFMSENVRRASAKTCSACGKTKVEDRNWYRNSTCPACYMAVLRKTRPEAIRSAKLKCYYGISVEHFNKLLQKQDFKCAICRSSTNKLKNGKLQNFVVDHCHKTKDVRGLLCHTCNMRVGIFENWGNSIREYLTSARSRG